MNNVNNSKKPWAPLPEREVELEKQVSEEVNSELNQNNFMDALESEMSPEPELQMTENGALGYSTTNSKLLDLNFSITSLRGASEQEIVNRFRGAISGNFEDVVRWLFFARDAREGAGERNLFRVCMNDMAANGADDLVKELINLIPEYGRWDDLLCLIGTPVQDDVLNLIKRQMSHDYNEMKAGRPITLLAKWLPSENATSQKTRANAKIIYNYLNISPRKYRKQLSEMRKYLDVVERKASSNNWQAIDYETVPSQANLKYKDAFMRHDGERRSLYLSALKNSDAKINASVLTPPEIVHKYSDDYLYSYYRESDVTIDESLEALWKALPDCVNSNSNTLVVADGSGSMTIEISRNGTTALDVANAMAIYFSERASGQFKNKYITFSADPQIVDLDGETLADNLKIAYEHDECSNTDIEKTFQLILDTAVHNHLKQEDLPENVLVISDMEFDGASTIYRYNTHTHEYEHNPTPDKALFELIAARYEAEGYKLPRLIFWNVNSRTNTIPMTQNEAGVILVSGFSQNVLKMVMNGETDPYKAMMHTLYSERYEPVGIAFGEFVRKACAV